MTQPRQRYQCSADEAGHTPCVSRNGGATDALTRELSLAEQRYITAARAPNTLRGYRSDWAEFTTWCDHQHLEPLPAAPATVSSYLTVLAGYGAKVGTMSRRLSSVKFAHRAADLADPTANARVIAVWEGIRRTHAAPPEQAAPLMPPELWDGWPAAAPPTPRRAAAPPDPPRPLPPPCMSTPPPDPGSRTATASSW